MVTMVGVGTLLISTGPAFAIWLLFLLRRAHLLVLSIISAFTWTLSLMTASVIWIALVPWKQAYAWCLILVVTCQEVSRILLFLIFRYVNSLSSGVQVFLRPGPKNECLSGMAVGVGYAVMSPLIQFFSILAADYSDDTAIYIQECHHNVFTAASAYALSFSIIHIMLGVLTWPAYSAGFSKRLVVTAFSYVVHVSLSLLTLTNLRQDGCIVTLSIIIPAAFVLSSLTFFVVRPKFEDLRLQQDRTIQ